MRGRSPRKRDGCSRSFARLRCSSRVLALAAAPRRGLQNVLWGPYQRLFARGWTLGIVQHPGVSYGLYCVRSRPDEAGRYRGPSIRWFQVSEDGGRWERAWVRGRSASERYVRATIDSVMTMSLARGWFGRAGQNTESPGTRGEGAVAPSTLDCLRGRLRLIDNSELTVDVQRPVSIAFERERGILRLDYEIGDHRGHYELDAVAGDLAERCSRSLCCDPRVCELVVSVFCEPTSSSDSDARSHGRWSIACRGDSDMRDRADPGN